MDSDQLKTFLEVNRTRHFGEAAKNLYLSQSTVSARIQTLEQQLGCSLFVRARNDIRLTPAGQRLLHHAEGILAAWNRARQDITLDEDHSFSLAIGALPSLWDISLQAWLTQLRNKRPDLALHGEVLDKDALLRRLLEATLDLAFAFEPPMMEKLVVEDMGKASFILVSSEANQDVTAAMANYVAVDWGVSFSLNLGRHFPDLPAPQIRLPLGRIAQDYIINCGGSAYLAEATLGPDLKHERLFRVDGAPKIERPVYALYNSDNPNQEIFNQILQWVRV